MTETEIAGRRVPIEPGPKTIIRFSSGRGGEGEAGDWEFWTAVGPTHAVTARCRPGKDPGERFCRMEKSKDEQPGWIVARQAKYLRAATASELEAWLNHPSKGQDAPHAKAGEAVGEQVRVDNQDGRYRVVPQPS